MEKFYDSAFAKKFGLSLVLDCVFLGFTYLLMTLSGKIFRSKAMAITNGVPADQFQQLLSTSPEQAQLFAAGLKSFVLTFIFVAVIVVVLGMLVYSLTRSFLWSKLLEKKFEFKKHWRWNLLTLAFLAPFLIFVLTFWLLGLFTSALANSSTALALFAATLVNFSLIILFFTYACFVFASFLESRKALSSLGNGFSLFKQKWKNLRFSLLTALLIAMVFNLLLSLLNGKMSISFLNAANFVFLIIFLAGLRAVIVKICFFHQ